MLAHRTKSPQKKTFSESFSRGLNYSKTPHSSRRRARVHLPMRGAQWSRKIDLLLLGKDFLTPKSTSLLLRVSQKVSSAAVHLASEMEHFCELKKAVFRCGQLEQPFLERLAGEKYILCG